jgi:metal-sulfur cluster biosynthetic enzyme
MFIQTETTGDPQSLRFLPGRPVLKEGTMLIRDKRQAARSPLALRLLDIDGVASVFLGESHVTVTRENRDWKDLKPDILNALMEHYTSGIPVITPAAAPDVQEQDETAALIWQALHRVIDPELGYNIVDIGLIYDVTMDKDKALVIMTTTTPGCPATDYLYSGAMECAYSVPGVSDAEVILTYEPKWSPAMMSDAAKSHFGITD